MEKKGSEMERILTYVHPIKVTIGPKSCNVTEKHRLLIIDENRFILEMEVKISGTPSCDAFIVYQTYDVFKEEQSE